LKIPEKINILGFDYDIILQDFINDNLIVDNRVCAGTINYHTYKIYINTMEKDEQNISQTLMHEIIHAIEHTFDRLNEYTNFTEWQIDMLATGLASIIILNDI